MASQFLERYDRLPFTLPFLATAPLTDVVLLFWLLPLWWILGVEQIVWPIALSWSALKLALGGMRRTVPRAAVWMLLFLAVNILSGFFIVEAYRYITFFGHLASYWTAFLLLYIVWNEVNDMATLRRVLRAMVAAVTMSAVLGCWALFGLGAIHFHALLSPLFPAGIADTNLGHAIVNRTVAETSWLSTIGKYPRVHGMFLFATMSAMATAIVIPVALLLATTSKRLAARVGTCLACLFLFLNLLGTTGRMALLALILGAVYWFSRCANFGRSVTAAALAVLIGLAVFIAAAQWSRVATNVTATVQTVHEGSLSQRAHIYRETIAGVLERPVLGWGTQRDIAGSPYPAGSHSYYLGVLYRNGIIGIVVLFALLVSIWRSSGVASVSPWYRASMFLRWAFVVLLINSASDIMDLDLTTFVVAWTTIAAAVVIPKLSEAFEGGGSVSGAAQ